MAGHACELPPTAIVVSGEAPTPIIPRTDIVGLSAASGVMAKPEKRMTNQWRGTVNQWVVSEATGALIGRVPAGLLKRIGHFESDVDFGVTTHLPQLV